MVIRLAAGDWSADVLPELGGAIGRLDWRGRAILRPTPEGTDSVLETACFPLVPYANRIDRGTFDWQGRRVVLGATPGFEPHALHGTGWLTSWTVAEADDRSARLTLTQAAGAWPWAWSAEQRIALDETGLTIRLSLTNEDARPMPGGVGLHPYLATVPGDRLTVDASQVWLSNATLIPRELADAAAVMDWRDGPALSDAPFVDHAYQPWGGTAELVGADRTVQIAAVGASRVHVFAPGQTGFVCVEPVSHRPDAHNAPPGEASGLVSLSPGQTLDLSMTVGLG
jgi:aldose 1-epimerase